MPEDVIMLFEDYTARFARGEQPDVAHYLERAGEDSEQLAALIDEFLVTAPPPEPSDEAVAALESWLAGEPPLLALRVRRQLKREAVVDALLGLLRIAPARRAKVADYYHDLESGLLDASRVDRRVLDALAETLGTRASDLLPWPARPLGVRQAYFRREPGAAADPQAVAPPARPDEPWDEVDELFLGPR